LLVVASAALVLLGIGAIAAVPFAVAFGGRAPTAPLAAADWAIAAMLGLLVDLALLLLLRSVWAVVAVGALLAVLGITTSFADRARRPASPAPRTAAFWLAFATGVACLAVPILGDPLKAWDARSIWFFHARMIYFAKSLGPSTGFGVVPFSHPDYPKLLPGLAAELASVRGFWNEYLPKGALLLLLAPALLGYFSLARGPIAFAFLVAMSWPRLGANLWNGHADGPLPLYGALAALAFARWLVDAEPRHLVLAVLSLGVACALKNEGLALAISIAIAAGAAWWRGGRPAWPLARGATAWLLVVAVAPVVVWEIEKRLWHLEGAYAVSTEAAQRLATRLSGDAAAQLLDAAHRHVLDRALVPLALAGLLAIALRTRVPIATAVPVAAAVLYTAVLALVYASSPYDLKWQIGTSAGRTLLGPILLLYAGAFCLLDAIERPRSAPVARGSGSR
jgi:hypothetical protein